jgi:hypothetical protein
MKVQTPLGEYPFEFRRLERREDGLAVIGLVAGLESGVVLGREDVCWALRRLGPALVVAGAVLYLRRRPSRTPG